MKTHVLIVAVVLLCTTCPNAARANQDQGQAPGGHGSAPVTPGESRRTLAVITPSRLLAGLHCLPDETVVALARLGEHPELVERLAMHPAEAEPHLLTLPVELRAAFGTLAAQPEILTAAAAMPDALASLHELYRELPAGAAARLGELRRNYDRTDLQAAQHWQTLLEGDAVAQAQYREWLTRFCNAQRAVNPHFPCVQVMAPSYYLACPPDAAFIAFLLQSAAPPDALVAQLERFWQEQGPEKRDERAQRGTVAQTDLQPRVMAGLLPPERAAMFKPTAQPDPAALGLVPAFLQPVADQAPEVQRLTAAGEMLRLWGDVPGERGGAPQAAPDVAAGPPAAGSGGTVIAQAPPGQTPPDFAAPTGYYVPSSISLSSAYYWGTAFPYSFGYAYGYGPYGHCCWPNRCTHITRDYEKRYYINYGYPYGEHGGFVNGRYVAPGEPFDVTQEAVGGRPTRVPRERFMPSAAQPRAERNVTGIGAIRHYPSALRSVGGARRSYSPFNDRLPFMNRTTPGFRRLPADRAGTGAFERIQGRRADPGNLRLAPRPSIRSDRTRTPADPTRPQIRASSPARRQAAPPPRNTAPARPARQAERRPR